MPTIMCNATEDLGQSLEGSLIVGSVSASPCESRFGDCVGFHVMSLIPLDPIPDVCTCDQLCCSHLSYFSQRSIVLKLSTIISFLQLSSLVLSSLCVCGGLQTDRQIDRDSLSTLTFPLKYQVYGNMIPHTIPFVLLDSSS